MTCSSFSSGGYNASRDLCVASGCHYVPDNNSCASTSTCTNGTCQNQCGDTTSCGTGPSATNYVAISPTGTIDTVTPTTVWSNPTGIAETYSNLWVFDAPNCVYPGSNVVGYNNPGPSDTSKAWSLLSGQPLLNNKTYSWYIWGTPVGALSNCQTFTTPVGYTCTVSLSTTRSTITVGHNAPISANVTITGGATVGSIAWTSSNPAVGTIPSPTVAGIVGNNVTGVAPGSTNITATVNLAPSGSCSTTALLPITVLPRAWWQVSGEMFMQEVRWSVVFPPLVPPTVILI